MKKIVEEKESTSTKNPAGKSAFQEVLFTDHLENIFISTLTFVDTSAFAGRKSWSTHSPACSVFHPPLG